MGDTDEVFKVIIIGDSGVGKSCFMLQFIEGKFTPDHNVTIGVEYGSKVVNARGKKVKMQIWDTVRCKQAGQEAFRAITRTFYRNADAVILMYDLTLHDSFDDLTDWLDEVRQNSNSDVMIFLVGNMLDVEDEREVSLEEAKAFTIENRLDGVYEASAKTSANVIE